MFRFLFESLDLRGETRLNREPKPPDSGNKSMSDIAASQKAT